MMLSRCIHLQRSAGMKSARDASFMVRASRRRSNAMPAMAAERVGEQTTSRIVSHRWGSIQTREMSGLSSLTSWVKDVVRTGSLQPPNPVLQNVPKPFIAKPDSDGNATDDQSPADPEAALPPFSRILPYHLDAAVQEASKQYAVDIASTEVAITSTIGMRAATVANHIDAIEAPIHQIREIGRLYSELANDDGNDTRWQKSYHKALAALDRKIMEKNSKIVYQALREAPDDTPRRHTLMRQFEMNGVHLTAADPGEDGSGTPDTNTGGGASNGTSADDGIMLADLNEQIQEKMTRLQTITGFDNASKAVKLQSVSDMYNVIGLGDKHAKLLGYQNPLHMQMEIGNYASVMDGHENLLGMMQQITDICAPHVAKVEQLNAEVAAGAFISSSKATDTGPTEDQKMQWEANRSVKQLLTMDGVLKGFTDFFESLFAIRIIEAKGPLDAWHQDVRLFHVYDTDTDKETSSEADSNNDQYLGSFYVDPYQRQGKADANFSRLLTDFAPIAVVSLDAKPPAWDNEPSPLHWNNARSVLFHMAQAVQLLLMKASADLHQAPLQRGGSSFLGHFMLHWLQNDGFVQRLATLSQDKHTFPDELLHFVRKNQVQDKSMDLMEHIFLAHLEHELFGAGKFHPRSDESLMAMQTRLAQTLVPFHKPKDLTPSLDVFRSFSQSQLHSDYIWSDILSANVFQRFQTIDMTQQEQVKRLGLDVRGLIYPKADTAPPTYSTYVELAGKEISVEALKDLNYL